MNQQHTSNTPQDGDDGHSGPGRRDLNIKVIYASAVHPYHDSHVDPATTVATLKTAVLDFFKLKEGNRPDGSVATYTLFYAKKALEDLNQRLSEVAHGEHELTMKLGETITQGDDQAPVTASDIAFEDDLRAAETTEGAARWKLERGAHQELFVTLSPEAQPGELYQVRLVWRSYPLDAPSLKFRDSKTGSLSDPKMWPNVRGFRPTNLDACVNYCAEGFNMHPEWRNDPKFSWRAEGNVLLRVLRILQSEMDDHYNGRFKG